MSGDIFRLRRPCAKCPFRIDVPPFLRPERASEIARDVASGAIFYCHETTVDDGEGDLVAGPESQFCAGSLLVMEEMDTPNQAVRMAERLGLYDPAKMDRTAPVAASLIEFAEHHGADEDERYCHVVEGGCEAPAGMLVGGAVVPAIATGEVHECPTCGEDVCDVCSDDEGVCIYCSERSS